MGLFNTLHAYCKCPKCGVGGQFDIQFKYGHTRQLDYRLGQPLVWLRENDLGSPEALGVKVEGMGGQCSNCGSDNLEFDIFVINNILERIEPVPVRSKEMPDGYEELDR